MPLATMTDWKMQLVPTAVRRFWVFSDLQQSDPGNARACMHTGVEDFLSLGLKIDAACYLGDATEGAVRAHLDEMVEMQVRALSRVDAPIYYVCGNHEFDYLQRMEKPCTPVIPMRDRVAGEPQWHIAPSLQEWTFSADFGELALFFFTDHCAPDSSWFTSHCNLWQTIDPLPGQRPHADGEDAVIVREALQALGKPVFTMSHYSFPGGNRDNEGSLQKDILPLADNVTAHFYGHSHIGDRAWGGENYLRQISTINDSCITQFDIASLENRRGSAIRSAIVEWYGHGRFGVFFRNHSRRDWEKCFVQ